MADKVSILPGAPDNGGGAPWIRAPGAPSLARARQRVGSLALLLAVAAAGGLGALALAPMTISSPAVLEAELTVEVGR